MTNKKRLQMQKRIRVGDETVIIRPGSRYKPIGRYNRMGCWANPAKFRRIARREKAHDDD